MTGRTAAVSALIIAASTLLASPAATAARDVVLVLDNSGSMRNNDPTLLLRLTVADFLGAVPDATRVGIIVFDEDARLAAPLSLPAKRAGVGHIASLRSVDYSGSQTNIPAAVERALYELRVNGDPEASRSIILLTDGFVDLGNDSETAQAREWLTTALAREAAANDISIYGLAFSEKADIRLLQVLAVETGGAYFRTYTPSDVAPVLSKIIDPDGGDGVGEVLLTSPEVAESDSATSSAAGEFSSAAPGAGPTGAGIADRLGSWLADRTWVFWAALIAVPLMLLGALGFRNRRSEAKSDSPAFVQKPAPPAGLPSSNEEYFPDAFLVDLHDVTGIPKHRLSGKYNLVTRIDGYDQSKMNVIVIPKSTVGRRHAMIEYRDFAFWLIDQNSVNGTFINGQRVREETRLKHGDRVRFHRYEFEFAMSDMLFSNETMAKFGELDAEYL